MWLKVSNASDTFEKWLIKNKRVKKKWTKKQDSLEKAIVMHNTSFFALEKLKMNWNTPFCIGASSPEKRRNRDEHTMMNFNVRYFTRMRAHISTTLRLTNVILTLLSGVYRVTQQMLINSNWISFITGFVCFTCGKFYISNNEVGGDGGDGGDSLSYRKACTCETIRNERNTYSERERERTIYQNHIDKLYGLTQTLVDIVIWTSFS